MIILFYLDTPRKKGGNSLDITIFFSSRLEKRTQREVLVKCVCVCVYSVLYNNVVLDVHSHQNWNLVWCLNAFNTKWLFSNKMNTKIENCSQNNSHAISICRKIRFERPDFCMRKKENGFCFSEARFTCYINAARCE